MVLLMFNFGIMGGVFGNVMQIFGASDKIVMLMNLEPTVKSRGENYMRPEDEIQQSRIELRDVKFHYPSKKDVQVLKGVSITVDNKEKRVIALVG
jgi:ABC-type multidrug transport system fused ATPase/permease subunit